MFSGSTALEVILFYKISYNNVDFTKYYITLNKFLCNPFPQPKLGATLSFLVYVFGKK